MRLRVLRLSEGSGEDDISRLSVSLIGLLLGLWGKCGGEDWALREIEHGATSGILITCTGTTEHMVCKYI